MSNKAASFQLVSQPHLNPIPSILQNRNIEYSCNLINLCNRINECKNETDIAGIIRNMLSKFPNKDYINKDTQAYLLLGCICIYACTHKGKHPPTLNELKQFAFANDQQYDSYIIYALNNQEYFNAILKNEDNWQPAGGDITYNLTLIKRAWQPPQSLFLPVNTPNNLPIGSRLQNLLSQFNQPRQPPQSFFLPVNNTPSSLPMSTSQNLIQHPPQSKKRLCSVMQNSSNNPCPITKQYYIARNDAPRYELHKRLLLLCSLIKTNPQSDVIKEEFDYYYPKAGDPEHDINLRHYVLMSMCSYTIQKGELPVGIKDFYNFIEQFPCPRPGIRNHFRGCDIYPIFNAFKTNNTIGKISSPISRIHSDSIYDINEIMEIILPDNTRY